MSDKKQKSRVPDFSKINFDKLKESAKYGLTTQPETTPEQQPRTIADYFEHTIASVKAPFEYLGRGMDKLKDNPVAGALDIGLGLVNIPFIIPMGALGVVNDVMFELPKKSMPEGSTGRKIFETEQNIFNGILGFPATAVDLTKEGIKSVVGEKGWEDIRKGFYYDYLSRGFIDPTLPEEEGLKKADEINERLDEGAKLIATLLAFKGVHSLIKGKGITSDIIPERTTVEPKLLPESKIEVTRKGVAIDPKTELGKQYHNLKNEKNSLYADIEVARQKIQELSGDNSPEAVQTRKQLISEISLKNKQIIDLNDKLSQLENTTPEVKQTRVKTEQKPRTPQEKRDIRGRLYYIDENGKRISKEKYDELTKPKEQPKTEEVKNATEEGKITESNQPEYQQTETRGLSPETSSSNRPIESGKIEEKVTPVETEVKAEKPTETVPLEIKPETVTPRVKEITSFKDFMDATTPEIINFVKRNTTTEEFNKILEDARNNPDNLIPIEGKTVIDMQARAIESAIYAKALDIAEKKYGTIDTSSRTNFTPETKIEKPTETTPKVETKAESSGIDSNNLKTMDQLREEFRKEKNITKAKYDKLSQKDKNKLNSEFEDYVKNYETIIKDEFLRRSKENEEQSRIETEKLNKQFEQSFIESEKTLPIDERIESKLRRGAELTPEEAKYFKENQYAPEGFYYDSKGNLRKKPKTATEPKPETLGTASEKPTETTPKEEGKPATPEVKAEKQPLTPKTKAEKEIWEQTKNEFVANEIARQFEKETGKKGTEAELEKWILRRQEMIGNMEEFHAQIVKDAFEEGKPVPPEILKEYYPDLAKTVKPTETTPKVEEQPTEVKPKVKSTTPKTKIEKPTEITPKVGEKSKIIDDIKSNIEKINKEKYATGEVEKTFDIKALPELEKIFSRFKNIDDLIENASLKEKMDIAAYINTGKYEPINFETISRLEKYMNSPTGMVFVVSDWLTKYVGIDTRGMIKSQFPTGKQIDIFALEKKIGQRLKNIWINSQFDGAKRKSDIVFQELTKLFKKEKPSENLVKAKKSIKVEEQLTEVKPEAKPTTPEVKPEKPAELPEVKVKAKQPKTTNETIERLKQEAKNELNNLSSGIDPAKMVNTIKLGYYYFKEGFNTFKDFSNKLITEIGEIAKPQILKIWNEVKKITRDFGEVAVEKIGEYLESKYNPFRIQKLDSEKIFGKEKAQKFEELSKTYEPLIEEASNPIKRTGKAFEKMYADGKGLASDTFRTFAQRFEKISPELFVKFRQLSQKISKSNMVTDKAIHDLDVKINKAKLTKEEKAKFYAALQNADYFDYAVEFAKQKGFYNEFMKVKNLADDFAAKNEIKNLIQGYWARMVKDYKGLRKELFEMFPDLRPTIEKLIAAREEKYGKMTGEQQLDYVNNVIRGYVRNALGVTLSELNSMKKRVLPVLDGKLAKYYHDPLVSQQLYLRQQAQYYHNRTFFGKLGDPIESVGQMIRDLEKQKGKQFDFGEITNLTRKYFNEHGIRNGALLFLRDMAISTKLGNIYAALVNMKDIVWTLDTGIKPTIKSLLTNNNRIDWNVIGYDPFGYAHELSTLGARHKFVSETMRLSGFRFWDVGFGKSKTILARYYKYQDLAKKDPVALDKILSRYLPDKADRFAVIEEFKTGKIDNISDRMGFVLFNELSDRQPITLLETPPNYAIAGNWRVVYLFKTYSIRQLDYILRESIDKIRTEGATREDKIKALGRFMKLTTMMTLVGATVDEIRDAIASYITGKKKNITFGERLLDNFFNLWLFSRYDVSSFLKEGGDAIAKTVTPPIADVPADMIIDTYNLLKQRNKTIRSYKNIPFVGKFIYEYFKKGNASNKMFPDTNIDLNIGIPNI